MNQDEAIKWCNKRPMTAWTAYGVSKYNTIVDTKWIKSFGEDELVYIIKGELFPLSPIFGLRHRTTKARENLKREK